MLRSGTKEGVSVAGKDEDAITAKPDTGDLKPDDDAALPVAEPERKPATAEPDATDLNDDDKSEPADLQQQEPTKSNRRRVSISVRTLAVAALIAAILASVAVPTWLYLGANAKLHQQAHQAADNSHAERVALDYAVDAAKINAQDLATWKKNLVKGTTPELKDKLSSAANSMEQILIPLQWNSTASPLVAKVRSNANGIYIVDTFVSVETKTVQAPDGVQSTATYSITIDSNHDWQISDVGGIGAVVGQK